MLTVCDTIGEEALHDPHWSDRGPRVTRGIDLTARNRYRVTRVIKQRLTSIMNRKSRSSQVIESAIGVLLGSELLCVFVSNDTSNRPTFCIDMK